MIHRGSELIRGPEDDGRSRGQILIEALIALAIFGILSVSFMGAIYASRTGVEVENVQSVAESLTRSEMEYVKESPFWGLGFNYHVPGSPPPWDSSRTALASAYEGYLVYVTGTPIDPSTHNPLSSGLDIGMQEILVEVYRGSEEILSTRTIKVNR